MMDVGLVGWRGMVGTVLLQRMREEDDFKHLNAHFYSTSNPGGEAPKEDSDKGLLKDAFDIKTLKNGYDPDLSGRRLYSKGLPRASKSWMERSLD